jgi:hypothetical protein
MPSREVDQTMNFTDYVQIIDASSGSTETLNAGHPLALADQPVFIIGLPAKMLEQAKANATKTFPWGGDYSKASAVSLKPGSKEPSSKGIFAVGHNTSPDYHFADGSTGVRFEGSPYVSYFVHPSFSDLQTHDYYVRITARRIGPGNVGMNLNYEVADSQGRSPYKNKGEWFALSADTGWQTHTWHITDACFSKMWGYDFNFHPENAAPFVIGKVEVSKAPF